MLLQQGRKRPDDEAVLLGFCLILLQLMSKKLVEKSYPVLSVEMFVL